MGRAIIGVLYLRRLLGHLPSASSVCFRSAKPIRKGPCAHKEDGKRYIVQSDDILAAFLELEATLL